MRGLYPALPRNASYVSIKRKVTDGFGIGGPGWLRFNLGIISDKLIEWSVRAGLSGYLSWKDMTCFHRRVRLPLELTFRLPLGSSL